MREAGSEEALFPADKRLLMHWNMRDEIKAQYGQEGALRRQRLLYAAMERVVDGGIARNAINSDTQSWEPHKAAAEPEGDGRYEKIRAIFKAECGRRSLVPR
jgi:hypothetical protein